MPHNFQRKVVFSADCDVCNQTLRARTAEAAKKKAQKCERQKDLSYKYKTGQVIGDPEKSYIMILAQGLHGQQGKHYPNYQVRIRVYDTNPDHQVGREKPDLIKFEGEITERRLVERIKGFKQRNGFNPG